MSRTQLALALKLSTEAAKSEDDDPSKSGNATEETTEAKKKKKAPNSKKKSKGMKKGDGGPTPKRGKATKGNKSKKVSKAAAVKAKSTKKKENGTEEDDNDDEEEEDDDDIDCCSPPSQQERDAFSSYIPAKGFAAKVLFQDEEDMAYVWYEGTVSEVKVIEHGAKYECFIKYSPDDEPSAVMVPPDPGSDEDAVVYPSGDYSAWPQPNKTIDKLSSASPTPPPPPPPPPPISAPKSATVLTNNTSDDSSSTMKQEGSNKRMKSEEIKKSEECPPVKKLKEDIKHKEAKKFEATGKSPSSAGEVLKTQEKAISDNQSLQKKFDDKSQNTQSSSNGSKSGSIIPRKETIIPTKKRKIESKIVSTSQKEVSSSQHISRKPNPPPPPPNFSSSNSSSSSGRGGLISSKTSLVNSHKEPTQPSRQHHNRRNESLSPSSSRNHSSPSTSRGGLTASQVGTASSGGGGGQFGSSNSQTDVHEEKIKSPPPKLTAEARIKAATKHGKEMVSVLDKLKEQFRTKWRPMLKEIEQVRRPVAALTAQASFNWNGSFLERDSVDKPVSTDLQASNQTSKLQEENQISINNDMTANKSTHNASNSSSVANIDSLLVEKSSMDPSKVNEDDMWTWGVRCKEEEEVIPSKKSSQVASSSHKDRRDRGYSGDRRRSYSNSYRYDRY